MATVGETDWNAKRCAEFLQSIVIESTELDNSTGAGSFELDSSFYRYSNPYGTSGNGGGD